MTTTLDQPRKTWRDRVFNRPTRPYIHPYLGGLLLGIVLFLAFFITGNGLGASGGLNRIVVFVQDIFAPEHVDRIPYLLKMAGGALNPLDDWVVPLVVGTIVGGFISGWFSGRLQVETNRGPHISKHTRWATALLGGAMMTSGLSMNAVASRSSSSGGLPMMTRSVSLAASWSSSPARTAAAAS